MLGQSAAASTAPFDAAALIGVEAYGGLVFGVQGSVALVLATGYCPAPSRDSHPLNQSFASSYDLFSGTTNLSNAVVANYFGGTIWNTVDGLTHNGYSDWVIPSYDDIHILTNSYPNWQSVLRTYARNYYSPGNTGYLATSTMYYDSGLGKWLLWKIYFNNLGQIGETWEYQANQLGYDTSAVVIRYQQL